MNFRSDRAPDVERLEQPLCAARLPVTGVVADVRQPSRVRRSVDAAAQAEGGLDALVKRAGIHRTARQRRPQMSSGTRCLTPI